MLQTFLHSFEWFLFPLSQKFIGIIEFPCLCKNLHWPHGKLIMFFFFLQWLHIQFLDWYFDSNFSCWWKTKGIFSEAIISQRRIAEIKMSFQISSYDNQLVKYNVRFFFVTLFFCKEKKGAKECLTKQHLSGEKEGKVHLGGGPGYFCKKKIWPFHFLE